jgi:hypothetical protein
MCTKDLQIERRDTVITKSLLAVNSSIILLILIAFPEGLQAGTIYDCRDQTGSITLSTTPLGKGYTCKHLQSYDDITDEDRKSWEKERNLLKEKREKEEAQEEKERIERRKKEVEAAKEARAEETLRAAQSAEEAAYRAEANAAAAAENAEAATSAAGEATRAAQEATEAAQSRPVIIIRRR